jgi:hypothetical protein
VLYFHVLELSGFFSRKTYDYAELNNFTRVV